MVGLDDEKAAWYAQGEDEARRIVKWWVDRRLDGTMTPGNLVAALREFDGQLLERQARVRPRLRTFIEELESEPSNVDAVTEAWGRFAGAGYDPAVSDSAPDWWMRPE